MLALPLARQENGITGTARRRPPPRFLTSLTAQTLAGIAAPLGRRRARRGRAGQGRRLLWFVAFNTFTPSGRRLPYPVWAIGSAAGLLTSLPSGSMPVLLALFWRQRAGLGSHRLVLARPLPAMRCLLNRQGSHWGGVRTGARRRCGSCMPRRRFPTKRLLLLQRVRHCTRIFPAVLFGSMWRRCLLAKALAEWRASYADSLPLRGELHAPAYLPPACILHRSSQRPATLLLPFYLRHAPAITSSSAVLGRRLPRMRVRRRCRNAGDGWTAVACWLCRRF